MIDDLVTAGPDVTIRRLRNDGADFELLHRWLSEPHVRAWWDPDRPLPTYQSVVDEYREFTGDASATTGCVIVVGARPIGYTQFYQWTDDAEYLATVGVTLPDSAWGLDLFIGETAWLGRGYGKRAVALICSYLVSSRGASEVVLITATDNRRAQHVYSSVGFTRDVEVLDTDTKDGQRIRSWVMRWSPSHRRGILGRLVQYEDIPRVGREKETLTAFLEWQRDTLARKCAGLDGDRLRERSAPPSTLSLLGLVRHMADVERGWFRRTLAGERVPAIYSTDADPDGEFDNVDTADVDEAFASWQAECERAREIVSERELDATGRNRMGTPVSLRWILVHMIEEYSRHNGHADLLRERIDGAVGY